MRSRYQFLREIVNRNSSETPLTQVILLLHDCWLPFLKNCALLDMIIHMDLPLSEELFLSRISLLRSSQHFSKSFFFVTSSQLEVLQLLHSKYQCSLTSCDLDDSINESKKFVEKYLKKHGDCESVNIEEIPLDDMTEEEKHELFYQNSKAEVILSDPVEYEELSLNDLDMTGLEECVEDFNECTQQENHQNRVDNSSIQINTSIPSPVVESNSLYEFSLINSIFNPFLNPLLCSFSQDQPQFPFSIF